MSKTDTQYASLNTQYKANLQNDQMNVIPLLAKGYENFRPFSRRKNKANQSQFKPNQTRFQAKNWLCFPRYWLCFSPAIAVKWLAKNNDDLTLWLRR